MFTIEKRRKGGRKMFLLVHFFAFTSNEKPEQTNADILVDTGKLDE